VICRDYLQGEKLKVGNLNELRVLIDRSETRLSEAAMNSWRAELIGPPHSHAGKEQVFYITDGKGVVHVGAKTHQVQPGSLVYIPEGIVHQSVTDHSAFTYFLFMAFLEPSKEGCASFAKHIEQVAAIRQQQAATGEAASDPELSKRVSKKKPRFFDDVRGTTTAMLVSKTDADGCEIERVGVDKDTTRAAQYADREQTLFVLSGGGTMNLDSKECELKPGTVIFVPVNERQSVKAGSTGLTYLSFSTFITIK